MDHHSNVMDGLTLVDIGLGVVSELVLLVNNSILGSGRTGGDVGIVVLSD